MSIEKLTDSSQSSLEQNPYTQICNSVTEHVKDNDAYRLYCYLAGKSRDWSVIKEWTEKVCGVGERKAKQCWAYLERCGLIEYIVMRDAAGKFLKHDIRVLNGTKFNKAEPFLKSSGAETAPLDKLSTDVDNLSTKTPAQWCKNPPGGESTRVVFAPLLNKDNTNKDLDTKKIKIFYRKDQKKSKSDWSKENERVHAFAESKNQMSREESHIAQNEEYKRSPMPDYLKKVVSDLKRTLGRQS